MSYSHVPGGGNPILSVSVTGEPADNTEPLTGERRPKSLVHPRGVCVYVGLPLGWQALPCTGVLASKYNWHYTTHNPLGATLLM